MSNNPQRGPPEWSNAPDRTTDRFEEQDGTLVDHGDPDHPHEQEAQRLLSEADMSNAPDWAKVLYHQQRAILDNLD